MMAKALCNDNKLSLEQLLINKTLCPEHKNEQSGEVLYPIMHIRAVLQCLLSLTLTFKGSVDYTFMQLFNRMSTTVMNKKGVSRTTSSGKVR